MIQLFFFFPLQTGEGKEWKQIPSPTSKPGLDGFVCKQVRDENENKFPDQLENLN